MLPRGRRCLRHFGGLPSGGPLGSPRGLSMRGSCRCLSTAASLLLVMSLLSLLYLSLLADLSVSVHIGGHSRAGSPLYPTECHSGGPPSKSPQGPLAFLLVGRVMRHRSPSANQGIWGAPKGPRVFSRPQNTSEGPLGGPAGTGAGGLKPLFPELQTTPEVNPRP